MGISVLYVRISSLDGKTERQRVNEEEFDKVIEDKCSGSIPIFEREGGCRLKKLIDEGVISPIQFVRNVLPTASLEITVIRV